jgi:FHA domain
VSKKDNAENTAVVRSTAGNIDGVDSFDDGKTVFVTDVQAIWPADQRTSFVGTELEIPQSSSPLNSSDTESAKPPHRARLPWPARDRHSNLPDSESSKVSPFAYASRVRKDDEATRLFTIGPMASASDTGSAGDGGNEVRSQSVAERLPDASGTGVDPVVGWLVIVAGPGKGRSIELGVGANPIGRDVNQKIRLNFGDDEVHREKHALVIYDPRSRRFFLNCGDVRNLTYLDDELVMTPVELKGREIIVVGQTSLRFVPFCGPEFSWV